MQVVKVWQTVEANKGDPRKKGFMMVAKEPDLMIALNYHDPGYKIGFHHHVGTSQSYLVLKGGITVRSRLSVDGPMEEQQLTAGDSVLIKSGEFYELENEGNEPVVLYQAKRPATQVQLLGRQPVDENAYFGVNADGV